MPKRYEKKMYICVNNDQDKIKLYRYDGLEKVDISQAPRYGGLPW